MGISASRAKLSLVACACLLLAACGGDDDSSTIANDNGTPPVSESPPPTSQPGTGGGPVAGAPGNSGTDDSSSDPTPGTPDDSADTPRDDGTEAPTDGTDGAPTNPSGESPSGPDGSNTPDPTDGAPSGSTDTPSDPTDGNSDDEPSAPTDEPPSDESPADQTDENEPPSVPNSPPTISGTPPTTVLEETPYLFVPSASDADGDILHFSIANLPRWAAFDTTTGRLEGTPSSADVGTYEDVRISVTDGADDAHLRPFSIMVTPVANGAVELSWTAPTENVDGSPLTDLAGYKIYWGTQPGDYPNSVTIDNPGIVTYVVEDLVPGTYYFVATAFNAEGEESDPSAMTSVTLP